MTLPIKQVVSGVWRGPEPESQQQLRDLREMGVKTVVNLEQNWPVFTFFDASYNNELDYLMVLGIETAHIPMSNILPPPQHKIISALDAMNLREKSIYVHCRDGVDRTGVVCAAYRVCHGTSVDDAIREMLALGFHSLRYWWWMPFIRKNLESIQRMGRTVRFP